MSADLRLLNDRFPRSAKYHPQWLIANGMSGAGCTLWLAEWLAEKLDLQPGMRVLDLGCGKASRERERPESDSCCSRQHVIRCNFK